MIVNLAGRGAGGIFNGLDSQSGRQIPQSVWRVAVRKLDMPNADDDLRDLRVPPANRLGALKRKWKGHPSIWINEQYRSVFKWSDGNARDVVITDYR